MLTPLWIESSKEQHLFEMEIFCKISMLNKSTQFFQFFLNLTDRKLLYGSVCIFLLVCMLVCKTKYEYLGTSAASNELPQHYYYHVLW